jgi:RNA polymerase sigma-70 factor (ECF subfamily)
MPEGRSGDTVDLDAAVSAAQGGDERAFTALYRALQPGLLRYLHALVRTDAEDVAAETWLNVTRDFGTFRGGWSEFRAWTVTIARHRALDHVRHQGRRPSICTPNDELTGIVADDDTAGRAIEGLSTQEAVALIASLPQDQAEAVMLRVVIGLDAKTAGRVLGKSAGAVRTATYRGLGNLSARLAATTPVTQTLAPTLKEVR